MIQAPKHAIFSANEPGIKMTSSYLDFLLLGLSDVHLTCIAFGWTNDNRMICTSNCMIESVTRTSRICNTCTAGTGSSSSKTAWLHTILAGPVHKGCTCSTGHGALFGTGHWRTRPVRITHECAIVTAPALGFVDCISIIIAG